MSKYLAVTGSIVEGLVFYGPFATGVDASCFEPETEIGPPLAVELLEPADAVRTTAGIAIVITGNPVEGLFFYGPFNDEACAVEWATRHHDGQDWWVTRLNPQEG